jgi:hypothetical protein
MVLQDVPTRRGQESSTFTVCRFVALGGMSLFAVQSGITLGGLLLSSSAAPWLGRGALMTAELVAALAGVVGLIGRWRGLLLVSVLTLTLDPVRAVVAGGGAGWVPLRGHLEFTDVACELVPWLGTVGAAWWLLWRSRSGGLQPDQTGSVWGQALGVLMSVWLANGPVLTVMAFPLSGLDMPTGIALASTTAVIYLLVLASPGVPRTMRWGYSLGSLCLLVLFLPRSLNDLVEEYSGSVDPQMLLVGVEVGLSLLVVFNAAAIRYRTPSARHAIR